MDPKKGGHVEAEIHDLDQGKESAGEAPVRNGNFELGMERNHTPSRGGGFELLRRENKWNRGGRGRSRIAHHRGNTGAMKRYPRRARVSTKRGLDAESPRASRNLVDRGIQAVIEVDEGVRGPELLLQFFARDDIAGAVEENGQHLERLPLQAQFGSAFAEFAGAEV